MRSTGVIRQVDDLGRVVLPSELRRTRRLDRGDQVEVFVQGELIILRKYEPACVFCGGKEQLIQLDGKRVCGRCRHTLCDLERSAAPDSEEGSFTSAEAYVVGEVERGLTDEGDGRCAATG